MLNIEANTESTIKAAERAIVKAIASIDLKEEAETSAFYPTKSSLTIAVQAGILKELNKDTDTSIVNMEIALTSLNELKERNSQPNAIDVKDYCCAILYLKDKVPYAEAVLRKYAFSHIIEPADLKELNAAIDITLRAMGLK